MTAVWVFAGLGVLFALAILLVLAMLVEDAYYRYRPRWRMYRRVLAEDLAALRAWAQMTRAHLRAVREMAREMERQSGGDRP
ncbi:hypothetical protein [Amycolatopsis mediterranei]|nr:hypothetical protein [Amycolatopsis mediterranei]UZF76073.1 hypothetical protein ISP_002258 [Amycolatopsis mediterranei]